jgi:hypothetical protein
VTGGEKVSPAVRVGDNVFQGGAEFPNGPALTRKAYTDTFFVAELSTPLKSSQEIVVVPEALSAFTAVT